MRGAGPTPIASAPSIQKAPVAPPAPAIDLTSSDDPSPYDIQREQSDRNRRRAEPTFQDGSFGFAATDDQMDVDADTAPTPTPAPAPVEPARDRRDGRRESYRNDRRDDRRDARYDAPRDAGRGKYYDRDRDLGRPRDDRRLYSDSLYPQSRGRGFR